MVDVGVPLFSRGMEIQKSSEIGGGRCRPTPDMQVKANVALRSCVDEVLRRSDDGPYRGTWYASMLAPRASDNESMA